jgi:serine phosphatase RsbU (regulator of sigma subunit)
MKPPTMNTDVTVSNDGLCDLPLLAGHSEITQALDTLESVHACFEKHGGTYMAVFEDGQIIGLCSRRRVGMALGSPEGWEKNSRRPICEFLLPEMTVVRVGQTLPSVLSVAFSRPVETLLDEVVLMDDNGQFLGLIPARTLVQLQYRLLRQNIEQIEKSRHELNLQKQEMENDLLLAGEIQQALLPPVESQVPGYFHIAHRYQPMGQVSGDFFHRLELAPDKVGLFVCDVMGHGVRSAFITAMLRALIQEMHHLGGQPGALLAQINEELKTILQRIDSPLYATAIYAVVEAGGRVTFACAGHPDSLLLRPGLPVKNVPPAPGTKGPALGMHAGAAYGQTEFQMQRGERLLLFTDGLCEIFNEQEQEFGREQLAQSAHANAAKPLQQVLDGMLADALGFASGKFQDDVCLVGVEFCPSAVPTTLSGSM